MHGGLMLGDERQDENRGDGRLTGAVEERSPS